MCRHRLARPYRTHFLRRVVANSEDKIHLRRFGLCKLFPTLAAQAFRGQVRQFDQLERFRTHSSQWVAARAVPCEDWPALAIENGLRHDRPSRIPRAQEQNIVAPLHYVILQQSAKKANLSF